MSISKETLQDMDGFGLCKNNIDSDGLITLYHGGKELPERLNKDEILFLTHIKAEAKDYARMREGEVFTLKVNPEYVRFNQGSYEIQYTLGGRIRNGEIIPEKIPRKEHEVLDDKASYKNFSIGDVLPRTNYEIIDIVIHSEDNAQFYLDTGNGQHWYDANTVIEYEQKEDKNLSAKNDSDLSM